MDIRLPIGLLFCCIGVLLAGFGSLSGRQIYQRSLGLNVNLTWGIVLLIFGVAMLALAKRSQGGAQDALRKAGGSGPSKSEHP